MFSASMLLKFRARIYIFEEFGQIHKKWLSWKFRSGDFEGRVSENKLMVVPKLGTLRKSEMI